MKIVQSYWSKPDIGNGRWLEKNTHYYSWALSCLKLKQHYNHVELVTDIEGKKLLIDELGLPYDSVRVVLDDINCYDSLFWAIGKIYAYSIQDEPFIHVDGDAFIWDKFPDSLEEGGLIAQHKEVNHQFSNLYYAKLLEANLDYYPNAIIQFRKKIKNIVQVNAGIIGGKDIPFIKNYCKTAFDFVNRNIDKTPKVKHAAMFNTIFEQYLFYCMAEMEEKEIKYLFDEEIDDKYKELVRFEEIPQTKFIHMLSYHKENPMFCEKIRQHLWYEFPYYYERISNILKKAS